MMGGRRPRIKKSAALLFIAAAGLFGCPSPGSCGDAPVTISPDAPNPEPPPAPPPSQEEAPPLKATDKFYHDAWKQDSTVGVFYSFQRAWLVQYQTERALSHSETGTSGLQFNLGLSQSLGKKITVQYTDGTKQSGKFKVDAIPASALLFYRKKTGVFSGKWGIGLLAYGFNGSIDLKDGTGLYTAGGVGCNVIFPFEGVAALGNGKTMLRLDLVPNFAINHFDFKNAFGRINEVIPFGGLFIGFSLVRAI